MNLVEARIATSGEIQWATRNDTYWGGSFEVGDREIEIIFAKLSPKGIQSQRWRVERVDFRKGRRNDSHGTVSETTAILSHIASAIDEFLKKVEPDILEMSPTNASREKLYRVVLKQMMPKISHAYDLEEKWYGSLMGEFVLTKLI